MNCINCSAEIPTAFVAAIKNNRCPACDQACMSETDHTALFALVNNISGVATDIAHDTVVKMAAAFFSKFDIFPKGVVVDNKVEKEVIYIRDTPAIQMTPPPYYNPYPTAYVPPPPPPPPMPAVKSPAKPIATRMSREELEARNAELKKKAIDSEEDLYEDSELEDDEIINDSDITLQNSRFLEEQAERKTKLRLVRLKAEKGGVKS